jgi:small subunit ribosomal protein S2
MVSITSIPGNDDAIRAIKLYVTAVADAALLGKIESGDTAMVRNEFVEEAAPAEAVVAEALEPATPAE